MNKEKETAYRDGVFDGYSGNKNNSFKYDKYIRIYNKGYKEGLKKAKKDF